MQAQSYSYEKREAEFLKASTEEFKKEHFCWIKVDSSEGQLTLNLDNRPHNLIFIQQLTAAVEAARKHLFSEKEENF